MNRAQRRAAAKGDARARAKRMGRRGYDMARHRASRWLIGACYEGIPCTREEDGETIHGLTGHWRFPPTVPASRWDAVADYAARSAGVSRPASSSATSRVASTSRASRPRWARPCCWASSPTPGATCSSRPATAATRGIIVTTWCAPGRW